MAKSDLIVMQEMASQNMDIRCSASLIEVKKVKGGASISFGIDDATGQMLMREFAANNVEHYCIMYVVNKEQFDKLKNGQATGNGH